MSRKKYRKHLPLIQLIFDNVPKSERTDFFSSAIRQLETAYYKLEDLYRDSFNSDDKKFLDYVLPGIKEHESFLVRREIFCEGGSTRDVRAARANLQGFRRNEY